MESCRPRKPYGQLAIVPFRPVTCVPLLPERWNKLRVIELGEHEISMVQETRSIMFAIGENSPQRFCMDRAIGADEGRLTCEPRADIEDSVGSFADRGIISHSSK